MPPLHTVEALGVVETTGSSQSNTAGGPVGSIVANNNTLIDSTPSPETENRNPNNNSSTTQSNSNNNTISAAADSSDNLPGTPQPAHHPTINDTSQNSSLRIPHHPFANHHIYNNSQTIATAVSANTHLPNQMYSPNIYSQNNMDLQHQQQQDRGPSYLQSYEQFYQQQQQHHQINNTAQSSTQNQQQMDFINSNSNMIYTSGDYNKPDLLTGVRFHPYPQTPTSAISSANCQNSNPNNNLDLNSESAPIVTSAPSSSLMSPRVVSSTSPSSSSHQMQISGTAARSISSLSAGNPSSPNLPGSSIQCKKCGIICTNEAELQEHITNVHGTSPYGSSGYAGSPYIKEDIQQQTPPMQNHQQTGVQQISNHASNPGEILDLDSQKLLYPPASIHQPIGNADPLHGLQNMQQRAGINSWDQQSQEGIPAYMQQQQTESKIVSNHSSFQYRSPKQSPYDISNHIKTEYTPTIKTEFGADTQQYMSDKSFDPTVPNQQQEQQQQMIPPALSSSPSEFPSTTTGGSQDNGQHFRTGNFEPPSSSSTALSTGPLGSKAANWKSNEPRRPKTYNCTACNKWFTSSGHLKRHYNTTLHKNAVKSSGLPDPATLPISTHHHPNKDPAGKTGRRGAAAAAAAAAVNSASLQQQPNPVQPPEMPNSPQEFGGPQVAAGGPMPLSQYGATTSPNSMYNHHQQYQQYMPQAPSATNASPQHTCSSVANQNLQQQQTVMNGHPNALAGPSVLPILRQMPMPSSQMRGLLNTQMQSQSIPTTLHILKNEQMETAIMKVALPDEVDIVELDYRRNVEMKEEDLVDEQDPIKCSLKTGKEESAEKTQEVEKLKVLQSGDLMQEVKDPKETKTIVEHHHNNTFPLATLSPIQHNQVELQQQQQQQQRDMECFYRSITYSSPPNSTQIHSAHIISHQHYLEAQQPEQQVAAQGTYTLTQITPSPQQQQLQTSITELAPFINIRLDTNSMLQLQQPLITTEQQLLSPVTTIPITSMANTVLPNHHHMQPPQQLMESQHLHNTATININIPSHTTTTNNIPSFHQLQRQGSALPPLDRTLSFPPTIIGNTGFWISGCEQEFDDTSDNKRESLGSTDIKIQTDTNASKDNVLYMQQSSTEYGVIAHDANPEAQEPSKLPVMLPPTRHSPLLIETIQNNYPIDNPSSQHLLAMNTHKTTPQNNEKVTRTKSAANGGRKRNSRTFTCVEGKSIEISGGRMKCLTCNKIFTKSCYLTQHNKSKHNVNQKYRCETCGKRFENDTTFVAHCNTHLVADKPHKCEQCIKQFHHKTDLRRHVDSIHTGNKQHRCDFCTKSFCRRDHLRKHLETHKRPRKTSQATKNDKRKKCENDCSPSSIANSTSTSTSTSTSASTSTTTNLEEFISDISLTFLPTDDDDDSINATLLNIDDSNVCDGVSATASPTKAFIDIDGFTNANKGTSGPSILNNYGLVSTREATNEIFFPHAVNGINAYSTVDIDFSAIPV